jgi:CRISPR-associated protein Csm5
MDDLEHKLGETGESGASCVLPLGWGAGFFSKTAFSNTQDPAYREILRQLPFYSRAIQSGLPFPKTRRIVFLDNQPSTIAGFVHLNVER